MRNQEVFVFKFSFVYIIYLVQNSNSYLNMKSFLLIFTIVFSSTFVFSQTKPTPKTDFTKMYLTVWLEAREHCLAVANAMPENLYNYHIFYGHGVLFSIFNNTS